MRKILRKVLEWILSLLGGKQGVYSPGERKIYSFWDGVKLVKADPMVLYKKVMAKGPDLSIDMRVANSPSKDAGKAHDSLVGGIRGIFGIHTFDGEKGLTEQESIDLLDDFMDYCEKIKKNTRKFPTSPVNSGASEPSTVESPATPSSSASGSTDSAPSTDEPAPSLVGSE